VFSSLNLLSDFPVLFQGFPDGAMSSFMIGLRRLLLCWTSGHGQNDSRCIRSVGKPWIVCRHADV